MNPNNPTATRSYANVAATRPTLRIKRKSAPPTQDDKRIRSDRFVPGGSSIDQPINLNVDRPDLESLFDRPLHMMVMELKDPNTRVTAVLDEFKPFHGLIVTNGIRINAQKGLLFVPFENLEDLKRVAEEYRGTLGTIRDPTSYDTTRFSDTFYRSVLVCSNILAWNNEQEIADAIKEVTDAEISNGIVSAEDNLITIYTPSAEDWLKLESVNLIYPTNPYLASKPGFYVLHKFAATNDSRFYKLFMSGLPENPHERGVRDVVKTVGATPCIIGLAFDKETHRALKYCFIIVQGESDRDKLMNSSGKFTLKRVPVTFALAQNKNATRPLA